MKEYKWNKHTRKTIVVILFLISFMFSNCAVSIYSQFATGEYDGDYPELYSIGINSILGAKGYINQGYGKWLSEIQIIEKDNFGRVLFHYCEYNRVSSRSFIISQKNDMEHSYYYPNYNFISNFGGEFSDDEIELLKTKNDWNMPVNIDKCVKVSIVRQKTGGPVRTSIIRRFFREALGNDAKYDSPKFNFFIKDNYNRSMYVAYGARGSNRYFDPKQMTRRVVVLFFQPNGLYDKEIGIMELTDLNNYQDDLKAFKLRNNWNVKP